VLLVITFNKSLSWKSHLDKLESELRKRVGILTRMTWQLPQELVIKTIEPIITAKLPYALELVTDTTKAETDMGLKRLHKLHRAAMKAALGIQMSDHPEDAQLQQLTRQASVHKMALRAMARLAWKCAHDWGDHPSPVTGWKDTNRKGLLDRQHQGALHLSMKSLHKYQGW
jgi:hypothetical protein